ncbi:hypothetical protein IKX12_01875 [Candidatus Saccharibacteria bacterium]|nr:hypothetical protein [Candidatus Saccharibacteria bacterium]
MAKIEALPIPANAEKHMTEEELNDAIDTQFVDYDEGKGDLVMPGYIETNGRGNETLTAKQEARITNFKLQKIGKSAFEMFKAA